MARRPATRSSSPSELGVPALDVKVVPADEDRFGAGHGYNTSPSPRTAEAIVSAAGKILAKGQLLAGAALETSPDSLTWQDGAFVSSADPSQAKTIADVALYAHGTGALPPGVEGGLDAQTVLQGPLVELGVDLDRDLVGDLQRPEQRGVGLHPERGLLDGRAAGDAAVVRDREVERDRRLLAAQVELAAARSVRRRPRACRTSLERNSIAQPFSTSSLIVFWMFSLSSPVSDLMPPVPSITRSERESAVSVIAAAQARRPVERRPPTTPPRSGDRARPSPQRLAGWS